MFFDESRPDRIKRAKKSNGEAVTKSFEMSPIPPSKSYELFDYAELNYGRSRTLIFDVESNPNYFLVSFLCEESGKVIYLEDSEQGYTINSFPVEQKIWIAQLNYILCRFLVIGFNSRTYDLPMVFVAGQGVRAPMLNTVSNEIILQDMQAFEVERKYCHKVPPVNHIDLIEVAPLSASLKMYAGRLNCERMQDLPFKPTTELLPWQIQVTRDYNINDLDNTLLLWQTLKPQIDLRIELGKEYNCDLRSRSDAQLAETVIVSELEKLGVKCKTIQIETGTEFYYKPPDFIQFKTPQFQNVLKVVKTAPFIVGNGGYADCPQIIEKLKPRLGSSIYRLGAGGLHSSEESVCHKSDENTVIIDRDVARYYPSIILNCELYPEHLGPAFLKVYRDIVTKRDMAKVRKDKITDQTMKIVINGSFGKLGNRYSKFYSPHLLIQVTMTGQLSLLMLIEMIELIGIPVVSANTDGIVIKCPKEREKELETIIIIWEELTGFITEETRYKGIYSRDVNNYIAVKEDGVCKTKGTYSNYGSALNSPLSKNPESYICSLAVQAYLADETPISQTILNCTDFNNFLNVRNVKGGAEKNNIYLGKVVRWYYAKDETGTINYILSGNKVPKSEGAKPCMILPDELPNDIDFDYYISEANDMLFDLGALSKSKTERLFND